LQTPPFSSPKRKPLPGAKSRSGVSLAFVRKQVILEDLRELLYGPTETGISEESLTVSEKKRGRHMVLKSSNELKGRNRGLIETNQGEERGGESWAAGAVVEGACGTNGCYKCGGERTFPKEGGPEVSSSYSAKEKAPNI